MPKSRAETSADISYGIPILHKPEVLITWCIALRIDSTHRKKNSEGRITVAAFHCKSEHALMSTIFRKPRRLTITVSQHVMERLQHSSDQQGRSLSNYAAFLLESALQGTAAGEQRQVRSGADTSVHLQRAA